MRRLAIVGSQPSVPCTEMLVQNAAAAVPARLPMIGASAAFTTLASISTGCARTFGVNSVPTLNIRTSARFQPSCAASARATVVGEFAHTPPSTPRTLSMRVASK